MTEIVSVLCYQKNFINPVILTGKNAIIQGVPFTVSLTTAFFIAQKA
jgi:hypothetical protein